MASWLLCIVPFFSRPFWTYKQSVHSDYDDPAVYPNSNVPHLPPILTDLLVSALLAVITWALYLEIGVSANAIRELMQPQKNTAETVSITHSKRNRASSHRRRSTRSTGASFTTHGYLPDDMRTFANRRISAVLDGDERLPQGESLEGKSPSSESKIATGVDGNNTQSSPLHTITPPPPRSGRFSQHVLGGIQEVDATDDDTNPPNAEGDDSSSSSSENEDKNSAQPAAILDRTPTGGTGATVSTTTPSLGSSLRSSLLSVDRYRAMLLSRAAFLRTLSPVLLLLFNVSVIMAHFVAIGFGEAHSLRTTLSLSTSVASLVYLFRFNSEYLNGLSILLACTKT